MSGHTPGPWQIDGMYPTMVLDASGNTVVETSEAFTGDRAQADARLIAAAPDLLRQVCRIVTAHDNAMSDSTGDVEGNFLSLQDEAIETLLGLGITRTEAERIAKAEGIT